MASVIFKSIGVLRTESLRTAGVNPLVEKSKIVSDLIFHFGETKTHAKTNWTVINSTIISEKFLTLLFSIKTIIIYII